MEISISPKRDREDLIDALYKAIQWNKMYLYSKTLTPTANLRRTRIRQNRRYEILRDKLSNEK